MPDNQQEFFKKILDDGMTQVTVDARRPEVVLPPAFKTQSDVQLNLSYNFGVPVSIGDRDIKVTLSFNEQSFDCVLPYSAIWRVIAKDGVHIFPDAFPMDLLTTIPEKKEELKLELIVNDCPELSPPRTGHLRLIHGGKETPPDQDKPTPPLAA